MATTYEFNQTFRLVLTRPLDVTKITIRSIGPLESDRSMKVRALRMARRVLGDDVVKDVVLMTEDER